MNRLASRFIVLLLLIEMVGISMLNLGVSRPMTSVDPLVLSELARARSGSIPVLIVCAGACASVVAALEREGIPVTSVGSMELGSVGASITREQLATLRSIPGIEAVEYDQEVGIFTSR